MVAAPPKRRWARIFGDILLSTGSLPAMSNASEELDVSKFTNV